MFVPYPDLPMVSNKMYSVNFLKFDSAILLQLDADSGGIFSNWRTAPVRQPIAGREKA
jgi:hypothetical protein